MTSSNDSALRAIKKGLPGNMSKIIIYKVKDYQKNHKELFVPQNRQAMESVHGRLDPRRNNEDIRYRIRNYEKFRHRLLFRTCQIDENAQDGRTGELEQRRRKGLCYESYRRSECNKHCRCQKVHEELWDALHTFLCDWKYYLPGTFNINIKYTNTTSPTQHLARYY